MDLLKEIGAILGFVAFGGLAVLVFMTFQQARHLRRLREWAGRAPERAAAEEARADTGAAEATMPAIGSAEDEPAESGPGAVARMRGEVAYRYEELDRRSPVSPLVLGLGLLALIAAAVILTGGFGLLSGDDGGGGAEKSTAAKSEQSKEPEVAVLNGTAPEGGVGVPGTAKAASVFVEDAGWKVGEVGDAGSFPTSSVMFEDGFKSDAKTLASDLSDQLGDLEVVPITPEVADAAKGADLAVVVGQDDQGIAG
ncbi:MAG: LytR C-terminal domain-containing protein [Solirubrobacterales bacterium]|nr:LytR C-terminal domain-containing protein [Solirubrobacterales bacterium]